MSSSGIYVAGDTYSSDLPVKNAYDSDYNGDRDIFLSKLAYAGDTLIYLTYLGGTDEEWFKGLDVENEYLYVVGATHSTDYPTNNAYDDSHNGGVNDGFSITQLDV